MAASQADILRQYAILQGINRIFQEALSGHSDEELGQTCLAVAEAITGSKFGFLGEINADGRLDDIAVSDPGWAACRMTDSSGYRRPPGNFEVHGIYGRVLRDGKGFFTNDPASHPDRIGLPAGHPPLTGFLGVPLIREGRTIGIVAVANREGGYRQEDLELLEGLVPAIVEAFARKRAEQAVREAKDHLEARVRERTAELEYANRTLQAEIAERHRAEAALRAERQRFQHVLDQLPAYLVLLSPDYRVPFENRFFRERFGESRGRRCYEYLFQRTEPCENCETYKVLKAHAPLRWEWTGPDGHKYDVYDFPFTDADGSPLIMEVGLDITERKQAEAELEQHRHRLEELVHQRTRQLEATNSRLQTEMADREQAEAAVQRERNLLRTLIDLIPDAIYVRDREERFLMANATLARNMDAASPDEMLGTTDADYYSASLAAQFAADDRHVLSGAAIINKEERIEFRDGRQCVVLTTKVPLKDATGAVVGLVGIGRDITERKQTEEAILRAKLEWERTFDSVPDAIAILNQEHRIVRVNRAMAERLDQTPEACIGQTCYRIVHGTASPPDFCPHAVTMANGRQHTVEVYEEHLGCHLLVTTTPLRDAAGYLIGSVHVARDITAHKLAEQALRESQEDLNHAQAVAHTGSWRLDVRRNELLWSDENHRIFGLPQGAPLTYETFLSTVHPDDRSYVHQQWMAALNGAPYDIEHRIVVDGQVKWVRERAELEFDEAGTLRGGFGTTQDITARKRGEERLRLLSEVASQLLASDQPQQIVEALCRKVMEHLDCHVFFNYLVDEQAGRLCLNACAGIPAETAREIQWLDYGVAVCGCVARDGCRIVAEHIQTTPDPCTDLVRSFGIQAYACHPLVNQGQLIGTLSFGSRTKPAFAEDELALMQAVTDQVAVAMQRVRLVESLKQHAQEAQAANVAKSQFLASMSHELRTPMNAILGMTDLALTEPLSDTVRDYLQIAKESADSLLELLNEILDFSRIEAGRFELESTPFSVGEAVEKVVRTLGVRAYEKGLELVCDLTEDLPDCVVGDPLRLRQVLMNLVGNAIKFTAKGEVVVRVRSEVRDQRSEVRDQRSASFSALGPPTSDLRPPTSDLCSLLFSVADTGIGIAAEDRERIFDPFTQADASTTRRYGGTGLGLAICHRLVTLMGGRIWFESQSGQGSTFYFTVTLPIGPPAGAESRGLPDREAFRDVPVLIVSENATSRRILHETLASWSMKPDTATDVPNALAMIYRAATARQNYRLVLADAVIPGVDGFTLAEWIKDQPELAGPVVLMLSATDRQNHPERCQAWESRCLEKPVSRSALLNAIARALGVDGHDVQPGSPHPDAAMAAPVRRLRVLLAEDTPANQKLVLHVLGRRGHTVDVAANGQEAFELLRRHPFDVVLMDVQMPVLDGFQATAAIRKLRSQKAHVPIIAMTAHALKGDQERCLAAGMDAYVSKPLNAEELIEAVERLAEPRPGEKRVARGPRPHKTAPVGRPSKAVRTASEGRSTSAAADPAHREMPVFSLDDAVHRCAGKYSLFQDMVKYFFDEVDALLEQMRTALHRRDAQEIGGTAHRLKGTVVYLGAGPAADATRRVEELGHAGDLAGAAAAIDELARQLGLLKQALEPHHHDLNPKT